MTQTLALVDNWLPRHSLGKVGMKFDCQKAARGVFGRCFDFELLWKTKGRVQRAQKDR